MYKEEAVEERKCVGILRENHLEKRINMTTHL